MLSVHFWGAQSRYKIALASRFQEFGKAGRIGFNGGKQRDFTLLLLNNRLEDAQESLIRNGATVAELLVFVFHILHPFGGTTCRAATRYERVQVPSMTP